jgi:bidirectional [NiFe] hydrogenase diaphorase subunit
MIKQKVRVKSFKINDITVTGRSDQTLLEVARDHDIFIPTLCYLEGLSCVGACRLCLVEVKGARELVPACTSKIKEDMEVFTTSEKIEAHRKMILSMIFSERSHTCSVCEANGDCELQNKSVELNMEHSLVPYLDQRFAIDASHKNFVHDPNRCILCTRCVCVCSEIEGANAINIAGRGINSTIIHDMDEPWIDSQSCTSCGKCVYVCPTGALYEKETSKEDAAHKREIIQNLLKSRHDNE